MSIAFSQLVSSAFCPQIFKLTKIRKVFKSNYCKHCGSQLIYDHTVFQWVRSKRSFKQTKHIVIILLPNGHIYVYIFHVSSSKCIFIEIRVSDVQFHRIDERGSFTSCNHRLRIWLLWTTMYATFDACISNRFFHRLIAIFNLCNVKVAPMNLK